MHERPRGGEVAVLGAGVTGCLVARALARRKLAPVVLETGGPRSGSGDLVSATVWDHTEPFEIARLGLESVERFHRLEEQVGPFGYLMTGGLAPAWTDDEAASGEALARAHADAGLPVRWLAREEVLQREPGLDPEIRGATYSPRESMLNANLLARRLQAASAALGATFIFHAGYVAVQEAGARFSLRTAESHFEVRKIVLTSGRWVAEVARQLGLVIPMRPVRRLTAVTGRLGAVLRHRVSSVRQEPRGVVVLEQTMDDHRRCACSAGELRELAAAARVAPALARAHLVRSWSWRGLVSHDRRPLVGEVEPGIFICVPHAPGVSLAPALAHAVSVSIAEGRLPDAVIVWSADRLGAALDSGVRKDSSMGP